MNYSDHHESLLGEEENDFEESFLDRINNRINDRIGYMKVKYALGWFFTDFLTQNLLLYFMIYTLIEGEYINFYCGFFI